MFEEVDDCLLVTWRFAAAAAALKERLVGEKAARDGLSLELGGLACPVLAVEMGVKPRRELCRLLLVFQTEGCVLVLLEPEGVVVGFVLGKEESSAEEGGGRLIDTAHTLRRFGNGCPSRAHQSMR